MGNKQFRADLTCLFSELPVFWREIYDLRHPLNEKTKNITRFKELCDNLISFEEEFPPITVKEVKKVLSDTKNYYAAETDDIKNFC